MSYYSEDPTVHDLLLATLIRFILTENPEYCLRGSDGGLPFEVAISSTPPTLFGYRADAIITTQSGELILEVKSEKDLLNDHTQQQLNVLSLLAESNAVAGVVLLVFGLSPIEEISMFIPPSLLESNKLKLLHNSISCESPEDTNAEII